MRRRLKILLWRRGLWNSPSASFLYWKGTILKPGKPIDYTVGFQKEMFSIMGKVAGLDSILRKTLVEIDRQIEAVKKDFERVKDEWVEGTNVYQLQDREGNYVLIPLLLARSNVLLAIEMDRA